MPHVERPLLLLPAYTDSERVKKTGGHSRILRPSVERQNERLTPKFKRLTRIFSERNSRALSLQETPDGIEPELALVFETIGSSANFLAAVKRIDGLEWMAEYSIEGIEPDDDFYDEKDASKELNGKVYCIMSDRRALNNLLSLWKSYVEDPSFEFERGMASLKDLFVSLKDIRTWSASDRFEDTGVIESWRECVEVYGPSPIPFEIELFFREEASARQASEKAVRELIESMDGHVTQSCVIEEIAYHGLAAQLPPEQIQLLLSEDRDNVKLAKADQIMFFRPVPQCMTDIGDDSAVFELDEPIPPANVFGNPVVALFDGMPLENHRLLSGRLVVDDPDGFASTYQAKDRLHGTEMASLIVHGDLNDPTRTPLDRALYVRPVMQNKFMQEGFPDGVLLVDLIHRAVRRMLEGDAENPPSSPSVKVINLSLGDPLRQYINSVSPVARLIDWLSWKYHILFIISAGNVSNFKINSKENVTQLPIEERTAFFVKSLKSERRNQRLLSPSESMNSLTVGAVYSDYSEPTRPLVGFAPVEDGLPCPASAIGPGIGRSIKPEIYVPGGKPRIASINQDGTVRWGDSTSSGPGCLAACPKSLTPSLGRGYCNGTSASAALTSHAAGRLYEVADDVFLLNGREGIPDEYAALLLKALLVHGADWSTMEDAMRYYEATRQNVSRWFGYGIPDFQRVEECAERRVTAIGFGTLKQGKAHDYRFPFPVDVHSRTIHRRLTVTLAYFTPITNKRQEYRKAQLWFTLGDESTRRLFSQRENTDWMAVLRGTVQHEIFSGSSPIPWGTEDEISVKVNCKAGTTTGAIGAEVPYAFAITTEVAEPIVGDLYAAVNARIHEPINIRAQE